MGAHVCVYQSVRGLALRGATVHLPRDAVASRTVENRDVGLALALRAGGIVTSTEAVVFDALGRAGSEDFKAPARVIRQPWRRRRGAGGRWAAPWRRPAAAAAAPPTPAPAPTPAAARAG